MSSQDFLSPRSCSSNNLPPERSPTFFALPAQRHGLSKHFVSDKGSQFTSQHFCTALKRLGIKQWFGAIGMYGSISIIERFWRTLKDMLRLRSLRALTPADLVRRIVIGLFYYGQHKPHQGLRGATPAEVYFGLKSACLQPKRPLREFELVSNKKPPDELSLEIEYLDGEHLLPILVKKAA
jgi:hypothetical protein